MMRHVLQAVSISLVMFLPAAAAAEAWTMQNLFDHCQQAVAFTTAEGKTPLNTNEDILRFMEASQCIAFVSAFRTGYELGRTPPSSVTPACIPEHLNNSAVIGRYVAWANEAPKEWLEQYDTTYGFLVYL